MDAQAVQNIPICSEIEVRIRGVNRENSIPTKVRPVADYLKVLMPNAKIEHLGRSTMVETWSAPASSSLFYQAAHLAFYQHYAFAIRPEVLMHLMLNEVATAVKLSPAAYRDLFTTSSEKQVISVRNDMLERGNPASPWQDVLVDFHRQLQDYVPGKLVEDCLFPFSTDTQESKISRLVAFMDAASPYYEYKVYTMCGIPRIRLLGEASDYQKLVDVARKFSQLFSKTLSQYFKDLIPVLEMIAAQARGVDIDNHFWLSMYKYESMSGSSRFGGWLSAFINFIQDDDGVHQKPDNLFDWEGLSRHDGISLSEIPSQVSTAPFEWNYYGLKIPMLFVGGVLAIDNVDGCLTPALSYAVVEK